MKRSVQDFINQLFGQSKKSTRTFSFPPASLANVTPTFHGLGLPSATTIQSLYPKGQSPLGAMLQAMNTSGLSTPSFKFMRGNAKFTAGQQVIKPQNYAQIFKTPVSLGTTPVGTPLLQVIGAPYAQGVSSISTAIGNVLIVQTPYGTLRMTKPFFQTANQQINMGGATASQMMANLQQIAKSQNISVPTTSAHQQAWSANLAAHKQAMAHAMMFGTSSISSPIQSQQARGQRYNPSPPSGFMIFDDMEDDYDYLDKSDPEYFEEHEIKPPDTEGYERIDP